MVVNRQLREEILAEVEVFQELMDHDVLPGEEAKRIVQFLEGSAQIIEVSIKKSLISLSKTYHW